MLEKILDGFRRTQQNDTQIASSSVPLKERMCGLMLTIIHAMKLLWVGSDHAHASLFLGMVCVLVLRARTIEDLPAQEDECENFCDFLTLVRELPGFCG